MNTTLVHWKEDPDFRGTSAILTGCISTLLICVWSAVHVDIMTGRSCIMAYLDKLGWLIVGLFAPEMLLFVAFNQLQTARHLTRYGQETLKPPPEPPSWTMRTLCWIIGRKDTPRATPLDNDQTPILAESAENDIIEKPCTVRKHPWTLVHGFYAAMGGFVLQDPLSVEPGGRYLPSWQGNGVLTASGVEFLMKYHPDLIPDIALDDILDRSKADGLAKALLVWQVLWFCLSCLNRMAHGLSLCLLEVSTIAHATCALLTYAVWWFKPKDVRRQTVISGPGASRLGAWMSITSRPKRPLMVGLVVILGSCESKHLIFDEWSPIQETRISVRITPRTPRDPMSSRLRALLSAWRMKYAFYNVPPWYIHDSVVSEDERRRRDHRLKLASENGRQFSRSSDYWVQPTANLGNFMLRDVDDTKLWEFLVLLLIPILLTATYGLLHLLGWNATFTSTVEQTLWRVATIVVTLAGATWCVSILIICVPAELLLDYMTGGNASLSSQSKVNSAVRVCNVVLYMASSVYLVVESFRQLFALPSDAFILPSWGDYWPHFS